MLDFEPTAKEFVDIEEPAFQLLDRDYQIFFEGFSSTDIYEGAIIKVKMFDGAMPWHCCIRSCM
jgi:hypothetical protein